MKIDFGQISRYIDYIWVFTVKDFSVRYKNTAVGFLWMLINPVIQMLVIGFVFRLFVREPIENYYLYLLIGLLVWSYFSQTVSRATSSIVSERNLIKKASFPREIIPLSVVLSNYLGFLVSAILVLFVSRFAFNQEIKIVGFLAASILLIVFTSGVSMLTSAFNVYFRDVNYIVQALVVIWFYATPIVYSINVIPYRLMWIWRFNPLTAVIQLFQNSIAGFAPPGIGMLTSNILLIVAIFTASVAVFTRLSKGFDDWL